MRDPQLSERTVDGIETSEKGPERSTEKDRSIPQLIIPDDCAGGLKPPNRSPEPPGTPVSHRTITFSDDEPRGGGGAQDGKN